MFFSFQVDGFTASSVDRVHLNYKMDVLDPHGVHIVEPVAAEIEETLAPEDKNWKPTVRQEIVIPPLADSGTYKIVISVTDVIGKGAATKEIPFEVHGRHVDPSDTLVIRNIRFYRGEDEKKALEKAAYRPGDTSGPVSISLGSSTGTAMPSTSVTMYPCWGPAAKFSTPSRGPTPKKASRSIPNATSPP